MLSEKNRRYTIVVIVSAQLYKIYCALETLRNAEYPSLVGRRVVTVQGWAGSWDSGRRKNIRGVVGMLTCLYSRVGDPCTLQTVSH